MVQRYGPYGVREYAIENEVNAPSYWAGSPEEYGRLVRAAAETIHATDPKARVVDSGISSVAYGMGVADRLVRAGRMPEAIAAYQAYFHRRVGTRGQQIPAVTGEAQLRRALGTETNSRSLRFLAVTESLLTDRTVDVRQVHFYEHFSGVAPLLDYLRATTPPGTPIQAWEVGQFWRDGDGDPASRAAEMVKTVTLLVAGGIGEVSWLPLAYNPNNAAGSEVRYGLLDPDGAEREAGRMLAALADAARGATVTPLPAPVAGRLHGVAFVRGEQSTLVLWSASNSAGDGAGGTGRTNRGGGFPAGRGRRRRHGDRRPRPAPRRPAGGPHPRHRPLTGRPGFGPVEQGGQAGVVRGELAASTARAVAGVSCDGPVSTRRVCRANAAGVNGGQAEEAQHVARTLPAGSAYRSSLRSHVHPLPRGSCAYQRSSCSA